MSFYSRYELLEPMPGEGKSFKGRETATGKPVVIHLLPEGQAAANEEVLRRVRQLGETDRALVLETGEYAGAPYVITAPLPAGQSLGQWLQAAGGSEPAAGELQTGRRADPAAFTRAGAWKVPAIKPEAPQPAAGAGPGEFTRMFQSPAPAATQATPVPPKPAAPAAPPAPPAALAESIPTVQSPAQPAPTPTPPPAAEPGEFTRLFQSPVSAPTATQATAIPVSPPTPPAPPSVTQATAIQAKPKMADAPAAPPAAPGEFTRQFQSARPATPAAPPPSAPDPFFQATLAPPPPASGPQGPGEFTRMFQSPLGSGTTSEPLKDPGMAAPLAPQAPPRRDAGEFTRMFGAPGAPAVAGLPQTTNPGPASPVGSGATQAFSVPTRPAAPMPEGPSEYTRMFGSPTQPPAPAAAAPPQPSNPGMGMPMQIPGMQVQPPGMHMQPPGMQVQTPGMQMQMPAAQLQAPPLAAPKPSLMPVVLILSGLLLIAILLMIYFALRH